MLRGSDRIGYEHASSWSLGWKLGVSRLTVEELRSCFSCGHVWTDLAPWKIRALLEEGSGELGKQYLATLEFGVYHDLPDLPEAHEAARRVAEMDVLVLSGSEVQARRRFREWTQSRWDETFDAVTSWYTLKRSRKLAVAWLDVKGGARRD